MSERRSGVGTPGGSASKALDVRLALARWPLWIALASASLAATGCSDPARNNVLASVLALEGNASVEPGAHAPLARLALNSLLGPGDIVRTDAASRVDIALLSNALLELGEESELEIVSLSVTKDGNETGDAMRGRYGHINLARGSIFLSHERPDGARAELKITTSQGEAIAAATCLYKLEAGQHHARLTSVTGRIQFRMRDINRVQSIPPGHVGEWNTSEATLVPAATDRRGKQDVVAALDSDRRLRSLASGQENRAPWKTR